MGVLGMSTKSAVLAALVGVSLACSQAKSAPLYSVSIAENGGAFTALPGSPASPGTAINGSGQFGDFSYSISAGSQSPNLLGQSTLTQTTITIHNLGAVAATLHLFLSGTGSTLPGGPSVFVTDSLAASSLVGGSATMQGNYNGAVVEAVPLSISGVAAVTASNTFAATSPFDFGNITHITLDPGGDATLTATTTVAGVPEPASILLGLIASIGLGGTATVRRLRIREN